MKTKNSILEIFPVCAYDPTMIISQMDVFLTIMACCNLNLRQIRAEKMCQCRLAVLSFSRALMTKG